MTLEIVTIVEGHLTIERKKRPTLDLKKRIQVAKEKTLPEGVDIRVLASLVRDAFPELDLYGMEQQAYFVDQDSDGGKEARREVCKKLNDAGFSAEEISTMIVKDNPRFKTAFHLGEARKITLEDHINRLRIEIEKYYPKAPKTNESS